jgi:hypothetical protein
MIVEYSSNNSGGGWWLTDEDWQKLEDAGWEVDWVSSRKDGFFKADSEGRWLGALAKEAKKEFNSVEEAISEWESITGQDADDAGCECCGQPHNFYEEYK